MPATIFFDHKELERGFSYQLNDPIRTLAGMSIELDEWLGRGGNAAVFSAKDRSSGEEVAIKFLLNQGGVNRERFKREIELLSNLQDDHIIRFRGEGTVRASYRNNRKSTERIIPFLVMDLADSNLTEVVSQRRGGLRYEEYSGQFRGLARALTLLHEHAIHRDIKPENILVVGDRWLLSDYGLCDFVQTEDEELTGANQNIGPKFWLSPEAHNRRLGSMELISKASDVFQLAAVFWYAATGRHPCGVVTSSDWIGPPKLFPLLHQSLFHDARKRPPDAREFLASLENTLAN